MFLYELSISRAYWEIYNLGRSPTFLTLKTFRRIFLLRIQIICFSNKSFDIPNWTPKTLTLFQINYSQVNVAHPLTTIIVETPINPQHNPRLFATRLTLWCQIKPYNTSTVMLIGFVCKVASYNVLFISVYYWVHPVLPTHLLIFTQQFTVLHFRMQLQRYIELPHYFVHKMQLLLSTFDPMPS